MADAQFTKEPGLLLLYLFFNLWQTSNPLRYLSPFEPLKKRAIQFKPVQVVSHVFHYQGPYPKPRQGSSSGGTSSFRFKNVQLTTWREGVHLEIQHPIFL